MAQDVPQASARPPQIPEMLEKPLVPAGKTPSCAPAGKTPSPSDKNLQRHPQKPTRRGWKNPRWQEKPPSWWKKPPLAGKNPSHGQKDPLQAEWWKKPPMEAKKTGSPLINTKFQYTYLAIYIAR